MFNSFSTEVDPHTKSSTASLDWTDIVDADNRRGDAGKKIIGAKSLSIEPEASRAQLAVMVPVTPSTASNPELPGPHPSRTAVSFR